MPLHVSSTIVLIIRRSKLYYGASGIVTLSEKFSFIQLLKLYDLLYMNCPLYRKCNLAVVKTCLPNFQHTANQERNDQCGNQHHSRELLMIGIVVPETC